MKFLFITLFTLVFSLSALAEDMRCYINEVDSNQSPVNLNVNAYSLENPHEVWCYQDSAEGTWLFNRLDPRAESTFLFKANGLFIQASLVKGEIEYHQLTYNNVSPTGHAFAESEQRTRPLIGLYSLSNSEMQKLNSLKSKMLTTNVKRHDFHQRRRLYDGAVLSGKIADENLPFRGYWWPHRGLPLAGHEDSPLQLYDRLVEARTGHNPGAADWENTYHSLQHVDWGGHCNGWAASSVIHNEPTQAKQDPVTGEVIKISDFKGMLAEASFCVKWAFYGRRYRDSNDDISDLHADRFHKVILYYLDYLKKPIAMDYYVDESVDNHVISGYELTVKREGYVEEYNLADNEYLVEAKLSVHGYDLSLNEQTGTAYKYDKYYNYIVELDANGELVSARWEHDDYHPDFLWAPLYQQKCGRENPRIDHSYILDWMENLPDYVEPTPPPSDDDGDDGDQTSPTPTP